jgi:hypothetical protein
MPSAVTATFSKGFLVNDTYRILNKRINEVYGYVRTNSRHECIR